MKKTLFLMLAVCLPAGAYASGAGTTAAPFLKAAMSPRAVAMGGAFSALADDSGAVFVNPAGLAQFDKREAALDFSTYLQDAKMGNLSYAGMVNDNRFGFGATFMTVGGLEKRGLTDSVGAVPEIGTFDASDLAITLAYAKKDFSPDLMPRLDGGFAVKFIRSAIDTKTAFAVAVDAGAIYHATEKINLSMAVQNLGTRMKFVDESDPLPLNLRAGAAYSFSVKGLPALLALDMVKERGDDASALLGAEVIVANKFPVRLGYNGRNDDGSGIAAGLGYIHNNFNFDYAFAPFKDLGSTHRFSVTYMWGRSVRAAAPVEAAVPVQQPAEPAPVAQPVQAPVSAAVEAPVAPVPQPVVPETAAPAAPAQPVESAPAAQPAAPEAPAAQPAEVPAPAAPETPAAVPAQ